MPDGEEGGTEEGRRVPNRMPDPVGEVVTALEAFGVDRRQVGTDSTPFGILSPGLGSSTLETRRQAALEAVLQTQTDPVPVNTSPSRFPPHAESHMAGGDDEVHSFDIISVYNQLLMRPGWEDEDLRVVQEEITPATGVSIRTQMFTDFVDTSLIRMYSAAKPSGERVRVEFAAKQGSPLYSFAKASLIDSAGLLIREATIAAIVDLGASDFTRLDLRADTQVGGFTQLILDSTGANVSLVTFTGATGRVRVTGIATPIIGGDAVPLDFITGGIAAAPFVTLGLSGSLSGEFSILEADETELPNDDIHWEWNRGDDRLFIIDNIGAGAVELVVSGAISIQDSTASKTLSILVTGDANPKMKLSKDRLEFGAGGASALDSIFKRNAAGQFTLERASADIFLRGLVTGDANPRWSLDQQNVNFGSGSAVEDVSFGRTTIGTLGVADWFAQSSGIAAGADKTDFVRVVGGVSALALRLFTVTGSTKDANARARYAHDRIEFGAGGASALDVNLYRNAADELKTDDKFLVALDLEVGGNIIVGGLVDGVDIAARDHAESHAAASHSDQGATGAELEELTDGSTTTLHSHAGGGGDVATDAIWDVKGDLAGGTGANTAARLAVGTNGTVLGALSSETTGLVWLTRSGTAQLADIANTESAGSDTTIPFGDHVHAHPSGLTSNLHHTKYTDAEAITAVEGEATLDLTGDVTIAVGKTLAVDVIAEKGAGTGVTIDGVLIKDNVMEHDLEGSFHTGQVIVLKTSNETIISDTTLQNDDELLFTIGANETWVFEFFVVWRAHVDGDIKFTITVPSGAAGQWVVSQQVGASSNEPTYRGNTSFGTAIAILVDATSVRRGAHIWGAVRNGATPGDITLQWAQNSSSGTGTIVFADSWMRATQIV
ncbi:hypothetical protein LCGC14_1585490 [marine sediment metagenome]|uniref:Uncharacterized protein n=1 Tax=marine sediment metagenome TaxID=412755 RepID=A0A0F9IFT3_9ZZZZ